MAETPACARVSQSHVYPAVYRPRNPQLSHLYPLLATHFDEVKAQWEDRFQKAYGHWRGFLDNVVARYLDCGVAEGGFARIVCEDYRSEFLLCLAPDRVDAVGAIHLARWLFAQRAPAKRTRQTRKLPFGAPGRV